MKNKLGRLKNSKVLIGVMSGILMILLNLGIIDANMSDDLMNVANAVLTMLIGLGIVSNPETPLVKKNKDK